MAEVQYFSRQNDGPITHVIWSAVPPAVSRAIDGLHNNGWHTSLLGRSAPIMGVSTATGAYALVLVVAFLCGYALGARHGPAFRQGAAKKVGPAPAPAPPVRAACTPPPLPTHAPGSQEDHEAVLR
ncbi:unnamed protein product [Cyclocybe aegerita]|uniref:Uncharacterized protein n=1 Tax=Cyclocybe aegerita TaxID=1973307 RepID=A0A8S0VVU8_CYCAE|nr:unnamed protein product [Cyclocybe aegerita]